MVSLINAAPCLPVGSHAGSADSRRCAHLGASLQVGDPENNMFFLHTYSSGLLSTVDTKLSLRKVSVRVQPLSDLTRRPEAC